jgi:sugar fermentation stimulation protein A
VGERNFRPFGSTRLRRARFVARPNRFLVHCRLRSGDLIEAFLPNPGRMDEMLFPDTELTVIRAAASATRRTQWTCVGLERDHEAILLDTHRTNAVAQHLLEAQRIPSLTGWRIAGSEVTVGHSRFDFLLQRGGQRLWLEVKSCTLFGNGSAMFPDAVTERGRRHLQELAHLRQTGAARPVVLFVVHSLRPNWFLPDYHTDLAFSRTLLAVRPQVRVLPVAVGWNRDFSLRDETRMLRIPWTHLQREVHDRGAYLLLLRLPEARKVQIGRLGELQADAGWYIYVGSAMAGLDARLRRHQRRRKKFHWHIDYLRQAAAEVVALPIRSSRRQECDLAADVAALYKSAMPRFGASDCTCSSHLFQAGSTAPLDDPAFHVLLQQYRMPKPKQ